MNLGKKIIAFITICSLFFINNFTYASIKVQDDNPYKQELLSIKNGYKYKKQVDNFVKKLDEKKAIKVLQKLEKISKKLENKNDIKSKKLKILLNYLVIEIQNKLAENLETTNTNEIIKNNISAEDKKLIEKEILKIQGNIFNNSKSIIEKFSSDFEKMTKYEEKGNLKINFDLDYKDLGELNSEVELKNYKVKNNLLDSSFNTEVNINIDSNLKEELNKKLKINSKVDYIQKDGIEYLLVEKFKVLDNKGFDKFEEYLDTFTKLAKENKYIEIENNQIDKDLIKKIKKINPKNILADGKQALSKPFLEAYNKTGNKYYLKPTRYACEKMKELADKFDPINGKKCSDSQYNDLLSDINEYGNLYLTINKNQKELIYEYKKTSTLDSGIISIKFDDKNINSVFVKIIPNQNRYKDEGLVIDYKNKEKFNIDFYADKGDLTFKLDSKLDNYNSFKNVKLAINSKGYRDEFRLGFILDGYKLNGNIDYITSRYDWETEKNVQSNIFNANISGQKNNWKLKITDKDLRNNINLLTSDIKYSRGIIIGNTKINNKDNKEAITIKHNGKVAIKYFELNNKITFSEEFTKSLIGAKSEANDTMRIIDLKNLQAGLEMYYSDYGEYPETINGNKDLISYLWQIPKEPLGAVEIDGCKFGYYYEVGSDKSGIQNQAYKLSTCVENSKRANNGNKFEITGGKIEKINKAFYINGYKTWKKVKKEDKQYNLEENINIKIDSNNNKNNFYLLINAILNSKEIFKFELINESKRTYKEIDIQKPKNTTKLEDVLK